MSVAILTNIARCPRRDAGAFRCLGGLAIPNRIAARRRRCGHRSPRAHVATPGSSVAWAATAITCQIAARGRRSQRGTSSAIVWPPGWNARWPCWLMNA
jgi:hypothetical protein